MNAPAGSILAIVRKGDTKSWPSCGLPTAPNDSFWAVALAGLVGFVGLVVPHALRFAVGATHRRLVPASFLAGAAALVLADLGARTLLAPGELPVGAITGLVGAPFFLALLVRSRRVVV